MRTLALVLGLFGSMVGLATALFTLFGGLVLWGGWLALVASQVAARGSALSIRKPNIAAGMMLAAAIAGSVGLKFLFALAAALLVAGALLAYRGRGQEL